MADDIEQKVGEGIPICCVKGKDGKHKHVGDYMVEMLSAGNNSGKDDVVSWCTECGAVVVDGKYDGRLIAKGEMVFPKYVNRL